MQKDTMFNILLLLSIVVTSCGKKQPDGRQFATTDPAVAEHVKEFEDNYGQPIGDIPINIVDLDISAAGECLEYSNGKKEILIDKKFWKESSEREREQVIFHELGHCELNREHDGRSVDFDGYNCPYTIMNGFVFNDYAMQYCYKTHRDYYMSELFD